MRAAPKEKRIMHRLARPSPVLRSTLSAATRLPALPPPRLLRSTLATASSPPANNGPGRVVGRSGKTYSPALVKVVTTLGKLLGYNLRTSHAITLTSDYYDRCAARFEAEKTFWVTGPSPSLLSQGISH